MYFIYRQRIVCIKFVFGLFLVCYAHATLAIDRVFINGIIYTVSDEIPTASVVAVDDGKIVFVGDATNGEKYIQSSESIIDLKEQMLMPGFIDTHNHIFEGASEAGGDCLLSPDKSLRDQKYNLISCNNNIATTGEWIIGYGHQFDVLMDDDPNTNPRQLLDQFFPKNPVIVMEESSHSVIVNSFALELAGIDARSINPVGGTIMFSPTTSQPNGVLFDNAGDIVMELAWNSLKQKFEVSYQGLLAGIDEVISNGITTVGDGRLYWRRGWHNVWQHALEEGEIAVRVSLRPWIYPEINIDQQIEFLKTIANSSLTDLLIVNQVKMYIDGVMHFGTAKMLDPYLTSWQSDLPFGLNYISPEALPNILIALDGIGYGAHIHAIGDGGVRETLDSIKIARQHGSQQIYSMTHLESIDQTDYERFNQLNVHADFQAGAEYFDKTRWASEYIGKQKAKRMMPMREIFESGANITFSSDWTVNDINPLVAISNSLRLNNSKGLPNIMEAIKAATINGAKALGLEKITGSIEVGKSADFVVLNRNITEFFPREIAKTKIVMTILKGNVVFGSKSSDEK